MRSIFVLFLFLIFTPLFWAHENHTNGSHASDFLDTTHLTLDLTIEMERKYIEGTVELRFAPLQTERKSLRLDATSLLIMRVEHSQDQGKSFKPLRYGVFQDWIDIYAPKEGFGKESLRIRIKYRGYGAGELSDGPSFGPGLRFVTDETLGNFAFTSVEPRRARSWYPCVDRPDDQFLYQGRYTFPEELELISNGLLISKKYNATKQAIAEWKHHFEIPTYLVSIAVGPFVLIQDRAINDLSIEYWVPKPLVLKAQKDFKRTPEMVKLFSEYFCPYPFEKYATVVVPGYGGAMEHTTATTYSNNLVTGDLTHERIVAHELGHHWFGDMVTCATWDDLWLNEGFAMFMELLWAEHIGGEKAKQKKLTHFRNEYYRHWSQMKTAVYDPKVRPEDKFHDTTYEKGGFVLHLLREEMGEENFKKGTQDYLKTFYLKNANTVQFQKVMEKAHGKSLEKFFQTWVYGQGHPLLDIELVQSNSVSKVKITQKKNPNYKKGSLTLEFLSENFFDSLRKVKIQFEGEVTTFELPKSLGKVLGVVFDPNEATLAKVKINQDIESWEAVYRSLQNRPKVKREALIEIAQKKPTKIPEKAFELWNSGTPNNLKLAFEAMAIAYEKSQGISTDKVVSRILPYVSSQDNELRKQAVKLALALFSEVKQLTNLDPQEKALLAELHYRLSNDKEMQIAWDIAIGLSKLKDPNLFPLLKAEMDREGDWPRSWLKEGILEAMGYLNDPRGLTYLQQYVDHENEWMRRFNMLAIGHLQQPDILWDNFLLAALNSKKEVKRVRIGAIEAYKERLKFLASHPDYRTIYTQAKTALEKITKDKETKKEIAQAIQKMLQKH